jgi:acyl-CoA synthetase (AMP-forming)/AMP-acid ligase II
MGRPAHILLDTPSSMATVTSLLQWHLEHNPTSPFAIFPGVDDDAEPVRVSFRHYANAVTRFARGLGSNEHSGRMGVIGLLIHCDTILYSTALAGVIAAGYTVSILQPINRPP